LAAIVISGWKPTRRFSFGFHRAETIGAFLSILLIYVLTGFLVWEAIERVHNPVPIDGLMMFVVALIGVVVNIVYV
jgi:zinc transporter 2